MYQNSPVRGQITLIRLQNFMTYDYIELRPGFNLNFIIGPNGTGKSSFVCAVMLAFGAKLKSVGRGDHIKSFVKSGCDEALIELELFEPYGPNLKISRRIDLQGHSQFIINGKVANTLKMAEIRNMFNINLDNLCSFLPQEKVQDFSKLTPQQILDQTQKAAGTSEMRRCYKRLIELLQEVRAKEAENSSFAKQIDELQQRNERIKDRVQAYIENTALCAKETLLKQKRAWLVYNKAAEELREIRSLKSTTEWQCVVTQRKIDKISRVADHLQGCLAPIDGRLKEIIQNRGDVLRIYRERVKGLRDLITRLENIDFVAETRLLEEEKRKAEVRLHQETLDKLKNDLLTFVQKNGTDEDLRAKERLANLDIENNQKEESEMMEKKVVIEDELEQLKIEIKNTSIEYRLIEKRRHFRLEYLKRYEPDVYRSVEWLKENRRMFRGRVFNPMLLELDITDVKYAKYMEARIAFRDLISFTCTNPDDLNLLIRKLRNELNLKVNAVCSDDGDDTEYRPEIPLDKIREFGFTTYMKDFIIGPPEIIRYLCKMYKIHNVPVGDETVDRLCEKVPRQISLFFSENHIFSVKISVYSGESSISVKRVNEPKIFTVSLNNQKLKEIIDKERALVTQSGELETKLKLAKHFLKNLNNKQEEYRQAKRNIVTMIAEKEQIENQIKRAENNIRHLESLFTSPETIQAELEKERQELKQEINGRFEGVKSVIKELKGVSLPLNQEDIKKEHIFLCLGKATKQKDELEHTLQKHREDLENFNRSFVTKSAHCETVKQEALNLTEGLSPGDMEFRVFEKAFITIKDTIPELDADLNQIRVLSEFMGAGDAELKAEYDEREHSIASMTNVLNESKRDFANMKKEFEDLRRKWLTPTNELISRINNLYSKFFETMGCVGEVSLIYEGLKDELDKYGIQIKVKFRDAVPLHPLGRHFQSGGERAVATAVYLLSLQELANVPFRFVDEINQGMDPVNEKRIIDLMVKVTDQTYSVQYFFITPKLLPNIEVSETMTVHCIYGGPVSLPSKEWNLEKYLKLA